MFEDLFVSLCDYFGASSADSTLSKTQKLAACLMVCQYPARFKYRCQTQREFNCVNNRLRCIYLSEGWYKIRQIVQLDERTISTYLRAAKTRLFV